MSAVPAWKQALIESRERKAREAEERERAQQDTRYANLPAWKRDLLLRREAQKEREAAAVAVNPLKQQVGKKPVPAAAIFSRLQSFEKVDGADLPPSSAPPASESAAPTPAADLPKTMSVRERMLALQRQSSADVEAAEDSAPVERVRPKRGSGDVQRRFPAAQAHDDEERPTEATPRHQEHRPATNGHTGNVEAAPAPAALADAAAAPTSSPVVSSPAAPEPAPAPEPVAQPQPQPHHHHQQQQQHQHQQQQHQPVRATEPAAAEAPFARRQSREADEARGSSAPAPSSVSPRGSIHDRISMFASGGAAETDARRSPPPPIEIKGSTLQDSGLSSVSNGPRSSRRTPSPEPEPAEEKQSTRRLSLGQELFGAPKHVLEQIKKEENGLASVAEDKSEEPDDDMNNRRSRRGMTAQTDARQAALRSRQLKEQKEKEEEEREREAELVRTASDAARHAAEAAAKEKRLEEMRRQREQEEADRRAREERERREHEERERIAREDRERVEREQAKRREEEAQRRLSEPDDSEKGKMTRRRSILKLVEVDSLGVRRNSAPSPIKRRISWSDVNHAKPLEYVAPTTYYSADSDSEDDDFDEEDEDDNTLSTPPPRSMQQQQAPPKQPEVTERPLDAMPADDLPPHAVNQNVAALLW